MSFVWYLHEKHSLCNLTLSDIVSTRIENNQIQLIIYSNNIFLYYWEKGCKGHRKLNFLTWSRVLFVFSTVGCWKRASVETPRRPWSPHSAQQAAMWRRASARCATPSKLVQSLTWQRSTRTPVPSSSEVRGLKCFVCWTLKKLCSVDYVKTTISRSNI